MAYSKNRMTSPPVKPAADAPASNSLVANFASKYEIEPAKLLGILKATAFKQRYNEPPATNEELAALIVVAKHYNLNPFTREIYAFRAKNGGISPIVGIDGWIKIVEAQPTYQGEEMVKGYDDEKGPDGQPLGFYYECFMHRSDRKFPISRRQYYKECFRPTEPWQQMPTRMLQHKAYIQSARAAFGLGGIYDEDEGLTIAGTVVSAKDGPDVLPLTAPQAAIDESGKEKTLPINEDQLQMVREKLAITGIPDNAVLENFAVEKLEDLRFHEVADVMEYLAKNSP